MTLESRGWGRCVEAGMNVGSVHVQDGHSCVIEGDVVGRRQVLGEVPTVIGTGYYRDNGVGLCIL